MAVDREPRQYTAVLIVVPDDLDFGWWAEVCQQANAQANYEAERSGILRPGQHGRTEITYPQLRRVAGVNYVYVAWKGKLRFRHQASSISPLAAGDVLGMGDAYPQWRTQLERGIGQDHQWVFTDWEYVPPYPIPDPESMPSIWAIRRGLVVGVEPEVIPQWR